MDLKLLYSHQNDTAKAEEKIQKKAPAPEILPYLPQCGLWVSVKPKAQNILFKNATVWTSEAAGILENTDVLVKTVKLKNRQNLNAEGPR